MGEAERDSHSCSNAFDGYSGNCPRNAATARAASLVRPISQEVKLKYGRATREGAFVKMNVATMSDLLSTVAEFRRWNGKTTVRIDPPPKIVDILLLREGLWRLPQVVGVITSPTLRPDGTVITEAGYDPETQLYHLKDPNLMMPSMPDKPTKADAKAALVLINELLDEFPFEAKLDRAVALSGILTLVNRGMFNVVPAHAWSASTAGTGKSYLLDVTVTIATGQLAPVMSCRDQTEMEKHLVGKVLGGASVIAVDNVNGELGGDLRRRPVRRLWPRDDHCRRPMPQMRYRVRGRRAARLRPRPGNGRALSRL